MADFTLSQLGGPQGSPVQPTRGVQAPSGVEAASDLFSGLVQSFQQGAPARAAQAKAEKENFANTVASRFSQQQLAIADAVDRGDLSSQEARMRMRKNYSSALADNPALVADITAAHKAIIGTAGLGKVAAEGTAQEQAYMKAQEEATLQGWVTSSMDQEQALEATNAYMSFNRAQQEIDAKQNSLALQRAQIGLQSDRVGLSTAQINNQTARINLQQKELQVKSQQALGTMADSFGVKFRNDSQEIIKQLESGQIDENEALRLLDGQWASVQQTTSQVGAQAGSDYVSNLTAPMQFIYEQTRARVTGEINNDILQNRITNAIGQQKLNIIGDEKVARIIATTDLLKNADPSVLAGPTQEVIRLLGANGKEEGVPGNVVDPENGEETGTYFQLLRGSLRGASDGTLVGGEKAVKEVQNNLNNVLRGINAYQNAVENPAQYNQVVEFLASPDYGQYVAANGSGINQDNASNARQVLQQQYEYEVLPLIEEEWKNAQVTTSALGQSNVLGTSGSQEEASSVIEPTWSGAGVTFRATESGNTRVNAKVKDLNKRVAPVLNRLIRMGAHLEGHKNYKQLYEGNYAKLFGESENQNDESN